MDAIRSATFEEELAAGRSISYFTIGTSMEPLLRERKTLVTIAPVGAVKPGDILLYRRGSQYVLHRLIRVENGRYRIRGDNTYTLETVAPEQVLGVVTRIHRKGKLIDVQSDPAYGCYTRLWMASYPIRYVYRRVRGKLRRVIRNIRRKQP